MSYWDTSALVPLLIEEENSQVSREFLNQMSPILTWALTSVEVFSALCRLEKAGVLSLDDFQKCHFLWKKIEAGLVLVKDIEAVKDVAYRLLRLHSLKAADSLQLAAAILVKGTSQNFAFVTFDQKLKAAALKEGFRVEP